MTAVTDDYCRPGCEGLYLTDGYVFSEENTSTFFMTEQLQGRINLIIDCDKLVLKNLIVAPCVS